MGDSSVTQISELPDLEDRVCVLESMIEELLGQKHGKGELEVVIPTQLLNQYVLLEESILNGVDFLQRNVKSVQDKKQIDQCSDKFNQINSDFQENWNDEFWRCYDMIKGGKKEGKAKKPDLNMRVAHLQELANTLNKSIKDDKKEETGKTEELEVKIIEPDKGNPDPVSRKCCNCVIS